MNTKINKEKINNFFSYYGWLIIVGLVVSFACWYYVISAMNEYTPNEVIKLFIEAYGIKDNKQIDSLGQYLKEDGVEKIDVHTYAPNSAQLVDYYTAFGKSSDIIVLHSKDLEDMGEVISEDFIQINEELQNEIMKDISMDYEFYALNNNKYAVKIYSATDEEYNSKLAFDDWITFKADGENEYDYYMLFSANSLNYGDYNSAFVSKNAIKAANWILKENIYEASK